MPTTDAAVRRGRRVVGRGRAACAARAGFTAAEGLLASVVLAASVAAISSAFSASYQQDEALRQASTALSLARQLMEEIVAKPYLMPGESRTPGPDPSDTGRSDFDSIKDYAGYSDSTSSLTTLDGAQALDLAGGGTYQRSVTIQYCNSLGGPTVSFGGLALVTVSVTDPQGGVTRLWQLCAQANVRQQL